MNERTLLEGHGVFVLMDALESIPSSLHHMLLRVLSDLCENNDTLAHLNNWASRTTPNLTALRLLVNTWQTEQTRLGVQLAEDDVLEGILCFVFPTV